MAHTGSPQPRAPSEGILFGRTDFYPHVPFKDVSVIISHAFFFCFANELCIFVGSQTKWKACVANTQNELEGPTDDFTNETSTAIDSRI